MIIAPLLSSSDVVEVPNADVGSPHPADLNLSRKECHLRTKKQLGFWSISNLFKEFHIKVEGFEIIGIKRVPSLTIPILVKCQPTTKPFEVDIHVHVVHYVTFCQHMEYRYTKPWDLKPFDTIIEIRNLNITPWKRKREYFVFVYQTNTFCPCSFCHSVDHRGLILVSCITLEKWILKLVHTCTWNCLWTLTSFQTPSALEKKAVEQSMI